MCLLPRSIRGTMTLAATAWLAGAVLLWLCLPVQPRATWRLPEPGRLVGFRADGRVLVTQPLLNVMTSGQGYLRKPAGTFRLCEPHTGRAVAIVGKSNMHLGAVALSPDGRWLLTYDDDDAGDRPRLFNLDTGDITTPAMSVEPHALKYKIVSGDAFSPDGRSVALIGRLQG